VDRGEEEGDEGDDDGKGVNDEDMLGTEIE
jgi:hypothetical protein